MTLAYIAGMADELSRMAGGAGQRLLAYLLAPARAEAARLARLQ